MDENEVYISEELVSEDIDNITPDTEDFDTGEDYDKYGY